MECWRRAAGRLGNGPLSPRAPPIALLKLAGAGLPAIQPTLWTVRAKAALLVVSSEGPRRSLAAIDEEGRRAVRFQRRLR